MSHNYKIQSIDGLQTVKNFCLPEADVCSEFSALSFLVFCFLVFCEALVLATYFSFGNPVSRSCSKYLDKETTFLLLKISYSSLVSHEAMADLIVSFNYNRLFWYKGQVARKCCSTSIIGSKNGRTRCDSVSA